LLQINNVTLLDGGHVNAFTYCLVGSLDDWLLARRRRTKRLPGNENDTRLRRVC
jgi:hypothetical protein